MKIFKSDNNWFYKRPHPLLRLLLIYVNGDMIFLLPLSIVIVLTAFFSIKISLIAAFSYLTLRSLGEMIYWLLQQFGEKTYRPDNWGFKKLDNNAIYILYQISSLVQMVTGLVFLILVIGN